MSDEPSQEEANVSDDLPREMIVAGLAGLLLVILPIVLGVLNLPVVAVQAIAYLTILLAGFVLLKPDSIRRKLQPYALIIGLVLCMSIVLNVFTIALLAQPEGTQEEICDQVMITPEPDQLTLEAPEEDGTWNEIIYTVQAPPKSNMRILFHRGQHLMNDGTRDVEIASGRHFTHSDKYIPAASAVPLEDGIWLTQLDVDKAMELGSTVIKHRMTFHMVSDQDIYCEKSAEVRVKIIRLPPQSQ